MEKKVSISWGPPGTSVSPSPYLTAKKVSCPSPPPASLPSSKLWVSSFVGQSCPWVIQETDVWKTQFAAQPSCYGTRRHSSQQCKDTDTIIPTSLERTPSQVFQKIVQVSGTPSYLWGVWDTIIFVDNKTITPVLKCWAVRKCYFTMKFILPDIFQKKKKWAHTNTSVGLVHSKACLLVLGVFLFCLFC